MAGRLESSSGSAAPATGRKERGAGTQVVLAGVPGAGKGTQAALLSRWLGIPHISTGDMFRRAIAQGTELGRLAERLINRGQFVPDAITIGIVSERICEPDCDRGYILDGFPRTLAQAKTAVSRLSPAAVILLDVEPLVAVRRIVERLTCRQCGAVWSPAYHGLKPGDSCFECGSAVGRRADDTETVALERMDVYRRLTYPAIAFLGDHWPLVRVDGSGSIDEVAGRIRQAVQQLDSQAGTG